MSGNTRPRVLALVLGTLGLAVLTAVRSPQSPVTPGFWFWLCVCFIGELLWVRLPLGGATVSMASCFHLAALLSLPRGQAMLATAATGVLAEILIVRKPAVRALFNAAQAALSVAAASAILSALSGEAPPFDWVRAFHPVALLVAAAAYFAVNSAAVSLAIALHEGRPFRRVWWINFGTRYELLANGGLFSLGALLAGAVALQGIAATALILFPLLVAYQGYRWYALARETAASREIAEEPPRPGGRRAA